MRSLDVFALLAPNEKSGNVMRRVLLRDPVNSSTRYRYLVPVPKGVVPSSDYGAKVPSSDYGEKFQVPTMVQKFRLW